ncbi:hypothetical protein [Gordonia iterans]
MNRDALSGYRSVAAPDPPPGWESEVPGCIWASSDHGTIVFSTRETDVTAAEISEMGKLDYLESDTAPRSRVVTSESLDRLGAIGLLPENGPIARLVLPGFEFRIVGLSDDLSAIEFCVRVAEYVKNNSLIPD